MAIVYQHRRLDTNEIFYIGIGKTIARSKSKKSRNRYWHHIVDKVGYDIEILHNNITWDDACELEMTYIKQYGRQDLGTGILVNMTDGGDGSVNVIVTEESRNKISKTHKDKPLSVEHRAKIGNANKGKNPNKNHTKQWIEEHSKKMKGENHPNFGKKINEEIVLKYSGENCVTSKLKNEDVLYIRKVYIKNHIDFGSKPLSIKFGVRQRQITDIIRRKIWKHL
jgi:hypothetical protein